MVRFYGLCDGKKNVGEFCVEMSSFLRKNFGARYLIINYHRLITFRLWTEVFLFRFLVHGKSMLKVL